MKQKCMTPARWAGLLLVVFLACGCIYETPLTWHPTRKIDEQLLGDWLEKAKDGKTMMVRKLSDSEYIIYYDGFYRAYHSDLDSHHFVSVQSLDSAKDSERKYTILTYELQDGGNTLVMTTINTDVIPATLTTPAALQKAIKANLDNPKLMNSDAGTFTRVQKQQGQ
jgi:hypothetical protein